MSRKSKKKNNRNAGKTNMHEGPSPQAQVYKGPLRVRGTKDQQSLTVIEMINIADVTSNGSGTINTVFNFSLQYFSNIDKIGNLYDEWRILGSTFEYVPNAEGATISSYLYAPIVFVWDRDDASALTGYLKGLGFESSKFISINQKVHMQIRMSGSEDSAFSTSTTTVHWVVKAYATGLSNSINYGKALMRCLIQCRGRDS